MNENETGPNLFAFAPSELSQDAVLSWLLSWSDPKFQSLNRELHEAGRKLLAFIFRRHRLRCPVASSVTVHRQVDHADLIAEVGDKYLVLIEDKTKTNHHGDQLRRYLRSMKKRYPSRKILAVFLKTEDQCEFTDIESCGYCICNRADVLSCIWPSRDTPIGNDVLRDWAEYLDSKERSVRAFKHKPVAEWNETQWTGFYQELRHHFPDLGWNKVPNAAGGFVGAWWGWRTVGRDKLYLQIDGNDLCIRVDAGDAPNRPAVRECWHNYFTTLDGKRQTFKLQRPARFGNGKTMAVAVVPRNEWLLVNAEGKLEIHKTLQSLRSATKLLQRACRVGEDRPAR